MYTILRPLVVNPSPAVCNRSSAAAAAKRNHYLPSPALFVSHGMLALCRLAWHGVAWQVSLVALVLIGLSWTENYGDRSFSAFNHTQQASRSYVASTVAPQYHYSSGRANTCIGRDQEEMVEYYLVLFIISATITAVRLSEHLHWWRSRGNSRIVLIVIHYQHPVLLLCNASRQVGNTNALDVIAPNLIVQAVIVAAAMIRYALLAV